jgi:hypothetical protein
VARPTSTCASSPRSRRNISASRLARLDQVYWYKSSEDYARWAAETLAAERATIERVGLLAKEAK